MKKILYIVPHLSTGGLPQYTLKMIKEFMKDHDVYCLEYTNISGGVYVVQRNQMVDLLGDKFLTLDEDKTEIIKIIKHGNFDVLHFQEIPEHFIDTNILNEIYLIDRNYSIVVTTHGSATDPSKILFGADKYVLVSNWSRNRFTQVFDEDICGIWEYPIEKIEYDKNEAKKELGFDPNYKHVLNVGLFTAGKNQKELIELSKEFVNQKVKFHFVGNQAINFRDYWEPLMENFPNNCVWHGERHDVDKFYKAADVFYFTSNLELNPLVVKEALSYGLPTFIKKLSTYNGEYDGIVTYIENDKKYNVENLCKALNYTMKKPKIQAIHLLTNTSHPREIKSIEFISKLSEYGIDYKQQINEIYDEMPPKETCRRPDDISDTPQEIADGIGKITGRHYGCFLAHKNAVINSSDDYDYTLIFEADANIETTMDEFIDIVYEACNVMEHDDVYYISLSKNPSWHKTHHNEKFSITSDQTLCHCYVIPNKHKEWYVDKFDNFPWDGYDIWLNVLFRTYGKKRYTTNKTYSNQIEGLSLIDNIVKWTDENKKYDYIEIGTSDFETLVEYMPDEKIGLSIEPIAFYLNNLPNKKNNQKLNLAISDSDYKTNIYYIPPSEIEKYNLPEWIKGCNSIDKPHPSVLSFLESNKIGHIYVNDEIECISFDTLIKRFSIGEVDLLKIDTEGNDITILKNLLKTNLRPKKILFEANSLYSEDQILDILDILENENYHIVHRDFNNITVRLKDDMYKETKKPILVISAGRRTEYLKRTLDSIFKKNKMFASKFKKIWLLDDRTTSEERSHVENMMNTYFGDNYNTINFNSNKPFDFVDKFNMIKNLVNTDDIVFLLEDDWECHDDIRLEFHVNNLINSDWTQIAFCDPLYAQVDEEKQKNSDNLDYWKNPYPSVFRHPVEWNGDMYRWFAGSINNWTNNPSLIKGAVFHKQDFNKVKNFEAEFANALMGKQVFTQEELFRHFGKNSLINTL
jgi:FkbM family methyltransferase